MSTTTADTPARTAGPAPLAARRLLALMARMTQGTLDLQLPDGRGVRLGTGGPGTSATVNDWQAFARALRGGDIGTAEGFIDGQWDTADLAGVLLLLARERDRLERAMYGSWWGTLLYRLRHALNRNTRRGSARNVPAHYDLGNAFYALWLDPSMNYSSAWFDGDASRALAEAQQAKIDRALDEAGVASGTRLLDIGCGWGTLALRAAGRGAQVTGITLSAEQLRHAQGQVQAAGLAPRCTLHRMDYRDLPSLCGGEPFDAVTSIEMFEAVGREYWPAYFDALRRCLKPGGLACVQSITLREDLFERYLRSTDFIQQYIFPGGLLPTVRAFEAQAAQAGLAVERRIDFGADYALTLRHWRTRYLAHEAQVRALGFDERFLRTWHFYLAYCEAAFEAGSTGVSQFTLRRL